MKLALFYQSLISDWNHGTAHFLRGVASELVARGHELAIFEPRDSWSASNLVAAHGEAPIAAFHAAYPGLTSRRYGAGELDLDQALDGIDAVIVHEWTDQALIARIGEHRARHDYRLLFHDTHHRTVMAPSYRLHRYDGVLAFGRVIRDLYRARGMRRAWTWHEAADVRVFEPIEAERDGDLVWFGNWGAGERADELEEMLFGPVRALRLSARVHGVDYPDAARAALASAAIDHGGWLPNFQVPAVFARFAVTVHVPRRAFVEAMPGIPTIRPFEALACGIPLVSAPWHDDDYLFASGRDYLVAHDGDDMCRQLRAVLGSPALARDLAAHGRETILARHTCAHRVDDLLAILDGLA